MAPSKAVTAGGAWSYVSGSHEYIGASPSLVPSPRITSATPSFPQLLAEARLTDSRRSRKKVGVSCPASMPRAKQTKPSITSPSATEENSRYLQDASRDA